MAITHDYVSYGTGNDYKGASFVDGAFTIADMTLTKAGAFAASKANHWLYLDDNGSNNVTPGYYKIATVTSNDAVVLATSPKSGATDPTDVVCTQHAGTALLPWRSIQGACDLLTRNTTDGNQVNLLAGVAQVNAAAIDLTVCAAGGALSEAAPLIIRGYTATANDGGYGEINAGGFALFAAGSYDYVMLVDLYCHDFGDNNAIALGANCVVMRCKVTRGASTPSLKTMVSVGAQGLIAGNYVYGGGTNTWAMNPSGACVIIGNYVEGFEYVGIKMAVDNSVIANNIIRMSGVNSYGIRISAFAGVHIFGNIVYSPDANTKNGIWLAEGAGQQAISCFNNIVCGISGAWGVGIGTSAGTTLPFGGYNAYWNNTTNYSIAKTFVNETANDVTLAADPFTDAANGDFSLTAAAKTALADKGFPTQYLGAHANTDSHLNIGPIQLTATAADYPAPADVEFGVTYDSGGQTGTLVVPGEADVRDGTDYGAAAEWTGALDLPAVADVQSGVTYDGATKTGTFTAPDAGDVRDGETYGGGGTEYEGTLDLPAEADVQSGVTYDGLTKTGTFAAPGVGDVEAGVGYGAAGTEYTGTFVVPSEADVRDGETYGDTAEFTGTLDLPAVTDVEDGVRFDNLSKMGTFQAPAVADVESGVGYGAAGTEYTGTLAIPAAADVQDGVTYGAAGTEFTGTFEAPAVGDVEAGVGYGAAGTEYTGTFAVPAEADVEHGVTYGEDGTEFTGTLAASDYPAEGDVEAGVVFGGSAYTGTFVVPAVGDVEAGVEYGDSAEFTGTFVVPAEADVELGVEYGDTAEFTGTLESGSTTLNAITTGNVTTIQGDDYDSADGRQLDWTVSSTATLTGGTVAVILPGVDTYTGSVTSETNVRLQLTGAQTAAIPVGKRKYQVTVTQTSALGSDVITVVEGTWTSKARVSE